MALEGKVAIVSGGSKGIGKAIAVSLAQRGAKVALTYFKSQIEEDFYEAFKNMPGEIICYKVDIKSQEQVKGMVADVVQRWKAIDIVVNNAGMRKDKTLAFMTSQEWDEVLDTNITGSFYLTQAAIYHMLKKRSGRIINISSISGIYGIGGQTNYSSSKAALMGFTKALAKEVAQYGISVNAIAPGGVDTDMVNSLNEKEKEKLLVGIPMGRLCTVEEVVRVVEFLADKEAAPDYLTGSVITLDGGLGL